MVLEFRSKHKVRTEFYEEKIAAAQLTQQCFDEIKRAIDTLNIPIEQKEVISMQNSLRQTLILRPW
jgi:hypothetical protein